MVRPPKLEHELPTVSGDWWVGLFTEPAVLHSAWKAGDGSLGLVFVNISQNSQEVSLGFKAGDYGFAPDSSLAAYSLELDRSYRPKRTQYGVFSDGNVEIKQRVEAHDVWAVEFTASK